MRRSLACLLAISAWTAAAGEPPRVLIVGDSISIGYTPVVASELTGVATVAHHAGNAQTSRNAVAKMPEWLAAGGPWAVVHLNVGLWDVARDGRPEVAVPLDEYLANLRTLVALARAAKATVLFATTTPVPERNAKQRRQKDVEAYNRAAVALMAELGVQVTDLHAVAMAGGAPPWSAPDDVHFAKAGYQRLGAAVAAAVRAALPATSAPASP